jgi:hypothetical protein
MIFIQIDIHSVETWLEIAQCMYSRHIRLSSACQSPRGSHGGFQLLRPLDRDQRSNSPGHHLGNVTARSSVASGSIFNWRASRVPTRGGGERLRQSSIYTCNSTALVITKWYPENYSLLRRVEERCGEGAA